MKSIRSDLEAKAYHYCSGLTKINIKKRHAELWQLGYDPRYAPVAKTQKLKDSL